MTHRVESTRGAEAGERAREHHDEVLAIVVELVRDTLALPRERPVEPHHLLFYDLGFTSLDLLDLLFRVEERFAIAIPEGTLAGLARGDLPEEVFQVDGVLTEVGRARLMALLHDTPAAIFPDRIRVSTLPRFCTVAAIARLAAHRTGAS